MKCGGTYERYAGVRLAARVRHGWAALLLELLAALEPFRAAEDPNPTGVVERQAGEDLDPGRDTVQVIGQARGRRDAHQFRAPGQDGPAVGAERDVEDRASMTDGRAERLAGGDVPEPRLAVPAPGEDGL